MRRYRTPTVFLAVALILFVRTAASAAKQDAAIDLFFAGDTVLSTTTVSGLIDEGNADVIVDKIPALLDADVFSLNLEAPLTDQKLKTKKKFNFKMNTDFITLLKSNFVTLVNLANNHMLDYGPGGVLDTVVCLDQAGIYHTGAGANLQEARRPVIIDIKGKRFGFLGYYGDGWGSAGRGKPGVSPRLKPVLFKDIARLKKKVDYVVVNMHWGREKQESPAPWQVDLAHEAIDRGADIIVGHHPHVLQGIEWYNGKVIAYSLGNFLFSFGPTDSAMLLHIRISGESMTAETIPIEFKRMQVRPLEGAPREKVLQLVAGRSLKIPAPAKK